MSQSLLLLSVAVLFIAAQATNITVHVQPFQGWSQQSGSLVGIHTNFWAIESGSTTPIYSSSNTSLIFHLTQGQTYTFHIAQPTFYHYSLSYVIENFLNSSQMFINFPVVPVASGVTVVNLDGTSYKSMKGAFVNFTFPDGVFDFDHASLYMFTGNQLGANFGAGVPPPQFYFGEIARFSTLTAGTYRVYSEARVVEGDIPSPDTSNSSYASVKGYYGIFAGEDAANGLKGSFTSANRSEINWYIGDIIVSKNAADCIVYEWATVNTYSFEYGSFDETNHPVTYQLTEECFDMSSPSALECVDVIFNQSEPQSTCGVFGDPHIIKFDRVGVTCGNQTYVILVDNAYFTIGAFADFAAPTSTATIFTSIVFTYKLPCNPVTATFTDTTGATLTGINAPLAYRHALRLWGSNIYIDALHLRFQVRQIWGTAGLTFGLSIPTSLATASTGICSDSCPGYEENLTKKRGGLANRFASLATAACDSIPSGTYEYESCVFDVGLTGNTNYASVAASFLTTKSEMEEAWTIPDAPPSWPEPTPDTIAPPTVGSTPGAIPSSGNPPTAKAPVNSSSNVGPTFIILAAVIIAFLF